MAHQDVWFGLATLLLVNSNPKRSEGFIGAFAGFACRAANIAEAVEALRREFEESGYVLVGVKHMLPMHMLDRQLTGYEAELLEAIDGYPVQFKDVHLHKGDG
jgi:hypothetical protein